MAAISIDEWIGVWSIERSFLFETGGAPERFRGQATVTPVGPALYLYSEEGYLEGLDHLIDARQSYWIRPEGSALILSFAPDPGRPDLAPPFTELRSDEEGALVGEHRCGEDRYRGRYRRIGPDDVEIEWSVEGPRKRGRIISRLRRVTDEMGYA